MPLGNIPKIAGSIINRIGKEYPMPAFYYSVYIADDANESSSFEKVKQFVASAVGAANGSFTEVSGLTQEIQTIDYRDGMDKGTIPRRIPGMSKFSNVTLKRGVFYQRTEFQEWLDSKNYNTIDRKTVVIELKDPTGLTLISWNLSRAYPIKIDGPTLKADGNEVAIESMELVHEGLKVTHEGII